MTKRSDFFSVVIVFRWLDVIFVAFLYDYIFVKVIKLLYFVRSILSFRKGRLIFVVNLSSV